MVMSCFGAVSVPSLIHIHYVRNVFVVYKHNTDLKETIMQSFISDLIQIPSFYILNYKIK
jgi:hypothetical protein